MDACIVLGVTSLAMALLLGSAAFAQTPPASTNKVVTIGTGNKFQQVLASRGTELRMLRIGNNNTNDDNLLGVCAKRFYPARNISATRRLCHRTRSKQPARRVQTLSMSNINKQ